MSATLLARERPPAGAPLIAFTQAWKELRAQPRFMLLFLFNFALGLSGLITMEAFRSSINRSISDNQRSILSADLAVTAKRPLTGKEQNAIGNFARSVEASSESVEFFTMVRGPRNTRLALLKAVDRNYPLRGNIQLESEVKNEGAAKELRGVWLEKNLAWQLGLKRGDELQIGAITVKIDDLLTNDPSQSSQGALYSGKIYLPMKLVPATGLLRPESTASYIHYFRASDNFLESNVPELRKLMRGDVKILNAQESGEESIRAISYLSDFLGLAALVALFLSALGAGYLFRSWLEQRVRSFALYQVLGWSWREATKVTLFQSLLTAFLATPLALLLAYFQIKMLAHILKIFFPFDLQPTISAWTVAIAFALSTIGSLWLSFPFLHSLRAVKLRELLGEKTPPSQLRPRAIWLLPSALLFYALAAWQAHSFRNAGIFLGALCFCVLFLWLSGFLLTWLAARLGQIIPYWTIRQTFLFIAREPRSSLGAFTALSLGVLLLNLLPQLRSTLKAEIDDLGDSSLPSLFFFDIQDEQLESLKETLAPLKLQNISPFVRSRLLKINGEPFEQSLNENQIRTREEETEARFRNRGFNLSYRERLSTAETLLDGRDFMNGKAEVSLEERFAERIGLKIGDRLLFDVQGVPIEARVVNTRRVRWMSFQPNFFILFPENVLNDAPKTFLASLPPLEEKQKLEIIEQIAQKFPNISVIDIRSSVERGMSLIEKMRWALNLMAGISLFSGLLVLYAMASRKAEVRRWDLNLCKVLGARQRDLHSMLFTEFFTLGFLASSFGAFLSVLLSWILGKWIFDRFTADFGALLLSISSTIILTVLVSWLGSLVVFQSRPTELLQET